MSVYEIDENLFPITPREDLTNSWGIVGAYAIEANVITAPDGTLADRLYSAAGGVGGISINRTLEASKQYTFSYFAMDQFSGWIAFRTQNWTQPGNTQGYFDLSTPAVGNQPVGHYDDAAVSTEFGDPQNWRRMSTTFTLDTDFAGSLRIYGAAENNLSAPAGFSAGVWGFKLEEGPIMTPYEADSGAILDVWPGMKISKGSRGGHAVERQISGFAGFNIQRPKDRPAPAKKPMK